MHFAYFLPSACPLCMTGMKCRSALLAGPNSRLSQLTARNGLPAPYPDAPSALQAYNFTDLQSFLDLYYAGEP